MAKTTRSMEDLFGVMTPQPQTMEQTQLLRNNLKVQHEKVSAEIGLLEKQLADKKEYLAKIEGGLDVLDELEK
jgi:hypothetical protein|tara:strand:- start:5903 stop:6121 length:219 start_codon:yes stop_codon:yes gene_type:complete